MARFIKSNGIDMELVPEKGTQFTLVELQDLVDGFIEIVPAKDGRLIVINEEGKLKNLPVNQKASLLYKHAPADFIVGDVLVCDKSEIR
jgi:hypothetical protein